MARARYIYNTKCLKCSCLNHEMIKVGPMVFCIECFDAEFAVPGAWDLNTNEVPTTCPEYIAWLEAYKKYIDKEISHKGT